MIPIQIIIALIFLVILSYIDIKTFKLRDGFIPSALTTSLVIAMFIFRPNVQILIFSALIGMLLLDIFSVWGFADLKILVALGLTIKTMPGILIFTIWLLFLTVLYQTVIKWLIKKKYIKELKEIPHIPLILLAYASMMLVGLMLI